jgi:hypothetical protein
LDFEIVDANERPGRSTGLNPDVVIHIFRHPDS